MNAKRLFTVALTSGALRTATAFSPLISTQPLRQSVRTFAAPGVSVSPSDDVEAALSKDSTTVLDVRTPDEILETGHWATVSDNGVPHQWVHLPCMPTDATLLERTAASLIPSKEDHVVIHCASGKRAQKAQETLQALGYKNVLNLGGWEEVQEMDAI